MLFLRTPPWGYILYMEQLSKSLQTITLSLISYTAKLDAMGHRWVASLGPYNFKLHYKSGKLNMDADSLSRINWHTVNPTQVRATMDLTEQ